MVIFFHTSFFRTNAVYKFERNDVEYVCASAGHRYLILGLSCHVPVYRNETLHFDPNLSCWLKIGSPPFRNHLMGTIRLIWPEYSTSYADHA